jgi:carbonic anhydrase
MLALLMSHWFYVHCIAALLFLPSASANCLHGTTLYKRSLAKRATTPFGYTDRLSPLNWGNLDPLYSVCETGIHQSPINLDDTISFTPSNPEINIPILKTATVENTGVLVEVPYPSSVNGTAIYDGITYHLVQFHFHTPGEHRLNEVFFPAEMHMVLEGVGKLFPKLKLTSQTMHLRFSS